MINLFDVSYFLNFKSKFETDNILQLSFTNIRKNEVTEINDICNINNLTYIIVITYDGLITFNITKLN
jgi:hypothetical protein